MLGTVYIKLYYDCLFLLFFPLFLWFFLLVFCILFLFLWFFGDFLIFFFWFLRFFNIVYNNYYKLSTIFQVWGNCHIIAIFLIFEFYDFFVVSEDGFLIFFLEFLNFVILYGYYFISGLRELSQIFTWCQLMEGRLLLCRLNLVRQ